MKIPLNQKWLINETEDYANYLFVVASWQGYTGALMKKLGFKSGRYFGAEYINGAVNLFALKQPYDEANREYYQMLFNKPDVWNKLHKFAMIYSDDLFKFSYHLKKLPVAKLSNKQILKYVLKFNELQAKAHDTRGPMWLLETPVNLVSNYLLKYLQENSREHKVNITAQEAFRVLVAPISENIYSKEKKELAKIALIKNINKQNSALKSHWLKYEWLEYGLQGKILNLEHFKNELRDLKKRGAAKVVNNLTSEIRLLKLKKKMVIKKFRVGNTHQRIFKIIEDSLYTRLYSKLAQFNGYYCMEPLFKEIGKRCFLTLEQIRFLAPIDFKRVLIDEEDLSELANERKKYSIHISNDGQTVFWAGKKAKEIRKRMKFCQETSNIAQAGRLVGQSAFPGKVKGRVKIVNLVSELPKMHSGNVLVSHMTNPDIVPAMKQAVAIVTDLGGITCHAAIVAREFKKPCVIGTKVATQLLKDGDMVEVDADKGEIRKLI